MSRHSFSGLVFLTFTVTSFAMCLATVKPAVSAMETPATEDIIKGKWTPQFEKNLNEKLPVYDLSRNFWGGTEYLLFRQGRKGVVVGHDGWLFTDEEFSCPAHAEKNLEDNLTYIEDTRKTLASKNVQLAVVVVPAKSRVFATDRDFALPACRTALYGRISQFLSETHIAATHLLPAMASSPRLKSLYLKTDTHWSPDGARLAAHVVRDLVRRDFSGLGLRRSRFVTAAGAAMPYEGDLLRYLPGVAATDVPRDQLVEYKTDQLTQVADASNTLFGDSSAPTVTLVGTSYSANPRWNFAGFLKESLQTDVLNAADEGLGPFTVMDKYLQSDAWKDNPPKLLIWEMPERYLLMPHGVTVD